MPGVLKRAAYGGVSGWAGLLTHWPPSRILLAARGLTAVLAQDRPGGVVVGCFSIASAGEGGLHGSASLLSDSLDVHAGRRHDRARCPDHYGHLDPVRQ
ncbi:MAG: hypothetical protein ACRDRL_27695 [Sciscionella sp.]